MLDRGRPAASGEVRDRVLAAIQARPKITRRELCQKFQKLRADGFKVGRNGAWQWDGTPKSWSSYA